MGLRGDVLSVLAVLSVPLALVSAFPREAVGFSASRVPARSEPANSIVFLDASAASRILHAAKVLPRNDRSGMVADLLPAELPGPDAALMISVDLHERAEPPSVIGSGIPPFLPSRRAAAPVRIPGGKADDELPFPRKELLRLN